MDNVTPEEHELPEIISVDDHVMEPRTLWQDQLPASLRDKGPRVSREKVRLEFKGGHYGFERGAEDGDWCDVWLFEDIVVPTACCMARRASRASSSATSLPSTRTFGPGPTIRRLAWRT